MRKRDRKIKRLSLFSLRIQVTDEKFQRDNINLNLESRSSSIFGPDFQWKIENSTLPNRKAFDCTYFQLEDAKHWHHTPEKYAPMHRRNSQESERGPLLTIPSNLRAAALTQRSHCDPPLGAVDLTSVVEGWSSSRSGIGETGRQWSEASNSVPEEWRFGEFASGPSHYRHCHYCHYRMSSRAKFVETKALWWGWSSDFRLTTGGKEQGGDWGESDMKLIWVQTVVRSVGPVDQTKAQISFLFF